MGQRQGRPVLLRTPPEFYRYVMANDEGHSQGGQKYFVQGNALAVSSSYATPELAQFISDHTLKSEELQNM